MTIGDRVKLLRVSKGWTQSELAEKMGYKSKSSVAHIENGRDIPRAMVVTLADILDTTPSYLMGWDDEKKTAELNAVILPTENIYMIPVFGSVAAGFGAYADSDVLEYIPLYIENPYDAPDTICIKVTGQSMYPKIENGDKIVVRKQSSVENGRIAVVMIDDEAVVKKVVFEDDKLILKSINPEYLPREITGAALEKVKIVGLVQQVIKAI